MTGTPEGSTESGFMEKPGIELATPGLQDRGLHVFVVVFLGCTSTGRVGFCFLWFYVQELPKAQPAVVLVLKRLRRRGNGLKSQPTDWEKLGIEPATPGLQDIGLSPTPRRLLRGLHMVHLTDFDINCTFKHFKYIRNLQIYELTFIDVSFF